MVIPAVNQQPRVSLISLTSLLLSAHAGINRRPPFWLQSLPLQLIPQRNRKQGLAMLMHVHDHSWPLMAITTEKLKASGFFLLIRKQKTFNKVRENLKSTGEGEWMSDRKSGHYHSPVEETPKSCAKFSFSWLSKSSSRSSRCDSQFKLRANPILKKTPHARWGLD